MTLTPTSPDAETDYEAEALLDPAFQYHPVKPKPASGTRRILLTGATGFLGVHLLEELLRRGSAHIFCLVRAADAAEARRRVIRRLSVSELWNESFASRIHAVAGDLQLPGFGLTEESWLELASLIDVVYHNGGSVNMALTYERLKPVNVNGTLEVLRFAGTLHTKPVHFISSLAVFFTSEYENGFLRESDIPVFHPTLRSGYSKSKFVADRLVTAAQERGLPGTIFRPVRIMGHSRTGESSDMEDILPMLLKGCILLGCCPAFDINVMMVPVDYVCQAVVHIAEMEEPPARAFHIFNPEPIPWAELMDTLRWQGYRLREAPYEEWWQVMKSRMRALPPEDISGAKGIFAKLTLALTAPNFLFYKRPHFDDAAIRKGLAGSSISCPPADADLIARYVGAWQKNGYLPLPEAVESDPETVL